ncbi:retinoid-binding protein 7 isoform X1 [Amia ocellicauda]|uniref:retinoid-binding protein 7 isoform X1 n=1 Tax=Amia ocellicauda TaxID=2972642 RepID=UPI003464B062
MAVNYTGTWDMDSNVNFQGYMMALGIDFATRKIAGTLKPQKVIEQNGDVFTIKTLSSLRNYSSSFVVGEEFEEDTKGLDNRKCKSALSLWCPGTMGSWCVFRRERRRIEVGHIGSKATIYTWKYTVKIKFAIKFTRSILHNHYKS